MQISLPPAAIGRGDTTAVGNNQSGGPQGKIAQLQAKAAKIQEQINALTDPKEDNAPTDAQSAKLRQEQVKALQQQLAQVMAEIARLQAEAAKGDESVTKEKGSPSTVNTSNLPLNSTFSITV
ncbi:FlxA-like family protein [Aeromonas allosaccharophila]|uniref:FlxA-like family protein n=1 Tax=Aeromonas allosaccharophila TaxID=656 RepID=UPI0035B866F9